MATCESKIKLLGKPLDIRVKLYNTVIKCGSGIVKIKDKYYDYLHDNIRFCGIYLLADCLVGYSDKCSYVYLLKGEYTGYSYKIQHTIDIDTKYLLEISIYSVINNCNIALDVNIGNLYINDEIWTKVNRWNMGEHRGGRLYHISNYPLDDSTNANDSRNIIVTNDDIFKVNKSFLSKGKNIYCFSGKSLKHHKFIIYSYVKDEIILSSDTEISIRIKNRSITFTALDGKNYDIEGKLISNISK